MKLSIVIPAYNEEESITETIEGIEAAFEKVNIEHEIFVVNDNSKDNTLQVLESLSQRFPSVTYATNLGPNGFGYAVRYGLERFSGDCVAVMMADLSDSPYDLIRFYTTMLEGNYDCVFGSRFMKGGKLVDYPFVKKVINRMANFIIRMVMGIKYNDTTNAFKLYKKEVIEGVKPILAPHFNLTIELPLKAIIRGYTYTVVPNSWTNRKYGVSKLKIKEMGSRYFFILMYCFVEKYFSRGDFKQK
ncbi:glycosyltransferase family 2 protein [Flavobacterium sp. MFBS3-15]|uniref:glycosyltransferase family 2 protein n=1 Tax=Flavobacterium sp. MFBS3-15 TaxID=2989816 RepID=UPI002235C845|nr:glycosyltransferase family 2 protein [Flavobacterium sp. MFBS3-15]MCW4469147.1 glycosyltransferase family 2 protein [Flavobacterium sp. MFBS3-15]